MKNIIKIGLVSLVGVFIFSGCGGSFIKVAPAETIKETKNIQADAKYFIFTGNDTDSDYGFTHTRRNNSSRFVFQGMALNTLVKGYKYFRVIFPFDSSSKMITTPKELHEACFNSGVGDSIGSEFGVIKIKRCTIKRSKSDLGGKAIYGVYKEKPNDALVINAQELIDYLKSNDLYTAFEKIENIDSYTKLLK